MKLKQKRMIKAIKEFYPNISKACEIAKIGRTTHYDWLNIPEYASAVKEAREEYLDWIENKVKTLAEQDNATAILFLAKTLAKHRGYIERTESHIKTESTHVVLTVDEKKRLLETVEILRGK